MTPPLLSLVDIQGLLGVNGKPAGRYSALKWALEHLKPIRRKPYAFASSEVYAALKVPTLQTDESLLTKGPKPIRPSSLIRTLR